MVKSNNQGEIKQCEGDCLTHQTNISNVDRETRNISLPRVHNE